MPSDLSATRHAIASAQRSATRCLETSLTIADSPACRHVFMRRFDAGARATAQSIDLQHAAGAPLPPLAGLAVSIKDLFDVAGEVTTAGSVVLAQASPAVADSAAVARLRRAGAALVGHTHMTEFAFSGVGTNPHHGTPVNPITARLDATPRIPGGSSSGAAVSVATGAAWAALGSDTGGSIRIPAALQGLVGFKNTARLTPLEGAVPLSTTLDTACAITHSVRDAVLLHEVLAQRTVRTSGRPISGYTFAVPRAVMLDSLDDTVAAVFARSLRVLAGAGARIVDIALPELAELAAMQATGGFSSAESWAWHRARFADGLSRYDQRVATRIRRGEHMSAADYVDLLQARRGWIARMGAVIEGFDALLSPTVPIIAPPIAPLLQSDEQFFTTNALLLRNPSAVNMLDGCALSLPCHRDGEMPVGMMIWAGPMADDRVLQASLAIEAALRDSAG